MDHREDKRKFKRFILSFPLTMQTEASRQLEGMDCLLTNLSLEGVALQSDQPLTPEQVLAFSFSLTLDNFCHVEEAKVVHCTRLDDGRYQSGVKLIRFRGMDHFKLARYLKTLKLIQNTTLLFQKLSLNEVRRLLSVCQEEHLEKGETLFTEGSHADGLFIVMDGAIAIRKDKKGGESETLAVVEDGEVFGEMAMLDDYPRTASAVAERRSALLRMERKYFHALLEERNEFTYNLMWIFLRLLCHRLRDSDKRYIEVISLEGRIRT